MIATELFLTGTAATTAAIEAVCRYATAGHDPNTVAIAVDSAHTSRVADLLFGTGVGTVSVLDAGSAIWPQARRSIAAGAQEIAVPLASLPDVAEMKSYLGPHTQVTLDVTTDRGLDPSAVDRALAGGVDFVSFQPDFSIPQGMLDASFLLELASRQNLVAVKIEAQDSQDRRLHQLFTLPQAGSLVTRSRVCLPAHDLVG